MQKHYKVTAEYHQGGQKFMALEALEDEPKGVNSYPHGCVPPYEPKEETLEEKFKYFLRKTDKLKVSSHETVYTEFAQIAKEHFQEHPENINCIKKSEAIRQMIANNKKLMKGMISHAEVLKVFDEASSTGIMVHRDKETTSITYPIAQIRKALEDISC